MIWLFERGREVLRLETRFDAAGDEYVLVVVWSDRVETERFIDSAAFDSRLRALEQQLAAEQWVQVGSPTIVADGWRDWKES